MLAADVLFAAVHGFGRDNVFVVGSSYAGSHMLHFDGNGWSPLETGVASGIIDIWGRATPICGSRPATQACSAASCRPRDRLLLPFFQCQGSFE